MLQLKVRIQNLLSLIQIRSFDSETGEGRARERHRRVLLSMFASAGARAISVVTLLISTRLTVHYLGTERYGLWATIASLTTFLSFADLGIGNGLLNAIAESHGRNDRTTARQYVSSALLMLTAVALSVGAAFAAIYPHVSWTALYNVHDAVAVSEAGPATAVFFACFLASIPLGVVQRIQQGYQEGFVDSLWSAGGKLAALMGVLAVIWSQAGLPWLVAAIAGLPAVASAVNGVALLALRKPWLWPRFADVRWRYARQVMSSGLLFFIMQIAGAFAYSADSLILAHMIGPPAVAEYNVVYQIFNLAPVVLSMVLTPLWPAYREAIVRGDSQWVRMTFRRSVAIGLVVNVPYSLLLVMAGNPLIHLWVGNTITASVLVLAAFGIWNVLNSFNGPIAMFLNGANAMSFQAVCAALMAVTNLLLSILLTRQMGLSGVMWGSVISQAIFILLPSAIYISRLMRAFLPFETRTVPS